MYHEYESVYIRSNAFKTSSLMRVIFGMEQEMAAMGHQGKGRTINNQGGLGWRICGLSFFPSQLDDKFFFQGKLAEQLFFSWESCWNLFFLDGEADFFSLNLSGSTFFNIVCPPGYMISENRIWLP